MKDKKNFEREKCLPKKCYTKIIDVKKVEPKAQRILSHLIARGRIDDQEILVRQLMLWLHYLGKKSPGCPSKCTGAPRSSLSKWSQR